jgi:hypothetical protein
VQDTIYSGKHWVEPYWVQSNRKKFWYYRYVWMSGKKLYHHHIPGGNVKAQRAIARKLLVEDAIASGYTPEQIMKLVKSG